MDSMLGFNGWYWIIGKIKMWWYRVKEWLFRDSLLEPPWLAYGQCLWQEDWLSYQARVQDQLYQQYQALWVQQRTSLFQQADIQRSHIEVLYHVRLTWMTHAIRRLAQQAQYFFNSRTAIEAWSQGLWESVYLLLEFKIEQELKDKQTKQANTLTEDATYPVTRYRTTLWEHLANWPFSLQYLWYIAYSTWLVKRSEALILVLESEILALQGLYWNTVLSVDEPPEHPPFLCPWDVKTHFYGSAPGYQTYHPLKADQVKREQVDHALSQLERFIRGVNRYLSLDRRSQFPALIFQATIGKLLKWWNDWIKAELSLLKIVIIEVKRGAWYVDQNKILHGLGQPFYLQYTQNETSLYYYYGIQMLRSTFERTHNTLQQTEKYQALLKQVAAINAEREAQHQRHKQLMKEEERKYVRQLLQKDEQYTTQLVEKDQQYATQLAEKDQELVEKGQQYATQLAEKDQQYAAQLAEKDKALKMMQAEQERLKAALQKQQAEDVRIESCSSHLFAH